MKRDAEATKAFYAAVFGWTAGRPQFEGAPESYTVWRVGGEKRRRDDADVPRVLPG